MRDKYLFLIQQFISVKFLDSESRNDTNQYPYYYVKGEVNITYDPPKPDKNSH